MKSKSKLDWHSVRVKSFLYFLLVATSMLTFFMFFAINFFEPIYKQSKEKEIRRVCALMIDGFKNNNLQSVLNNEINPNEVDALLFVVENDTGVVIFNGTRVDEVSLLARIKYFIDSLSSSPDTDVLYTTTENGTKTLVYGTSEAINGKTYYFMASTKLLPVESTLRTFSTSILLIFIGSIMLAGTLSLIFSNSISAPLQKMSNSAKSLSKNNLSTQFDGSGYTESEQLSNTLNYAVGELKKTDELRNELVSNVSHELKTPLTMIKSYAELIKDITGDDKEKRDHDLDVIIEESKRLETLISDMLDFSKLKSKTIVYNFNEFDLSDMLQKMVKKYKTKYEPTGYNITLECPENALVNADYNRIQQVITNLLNNAINYSKENKNICIKLERLENGKLKLSVIDHGIGIPEENIPQVFDRHFRATNAERVSVGSGIGLSIVKQILDDHHLQFGVKSKINEGSTFFIVFNEIQKRNDS